MSSGFVVQPLDDRHRTDAFDCGQAELTSWLRDHARHATRQGTRTYVLVEPGSVEVHGFFAVAPHVVQRDDLPRRIGRGAPRQVPAVLLAKLALDVRAQGRGLGRELLIRALDTIVTSAHAAGGKLVVVDAVDRDAARFYEHHDFLPVPGNPHRLVLKLSTAADALGVEWP